MIRKIFIIVSLIAVFTVSILGTIQAQTVETLSTLSNDSLKIGQRLVYELNLKAPEGFEVEWPVWPDTLAGKIEILSQSKVEKIPIDDKGNIHLKQKIVITSFDEGSKSIAGLKLRFKPKGDTTHYFAQTNPVFFQVFSVAVDTAQAFKPIIGPIKEPITFMEILPWILAILGIVILIYGIFWYLKRRQKIIPAFKAFAKPQIPAYVVALEKLEELRYQKLWQAGQIKEYYTALTDIVRVYIEDQFGVSAVEMTTEEILDGIKHLNINALAVNKLNEVLHLADFVKFAKANPSPVENDICLNHLVDFVNESHPSVAVEIEVVASQTEVNQEVI